MEINNKIRLNIISFLSYSLTGALIVTTGVILSNVAKYFNVPITSVSNSFTFLNTGILIAIISNTWLINVFSTKQQLIQGFIIMCLSVLGLIFGNNLKIFSISIFFLGIVSGITMSIGTQIITSLYHGKQRGVQLLITDSFFSMSAMFFPILSSTLLSYHFSWYWIYVYICMLYVIIFFLALFSQFPYQKEKELTNVLGIDKSWGTTVFLLSLASLCYILGQLSFISWIPEYVINNFKMSIQQSGNLVGKFWFAYMVGMWVFSTLLKFFDLQKITTVLSAISVILMYMFIHSKNIILINLYLLGLGFFSSAIYTSIITLGSQQVRCTSYRLVNFLLTCGTVGTMLTFIITSPIIYHYGIYVSLLTSNMLYFIVFILCFFSGFISKHKEFYNNK